MESDELVFQIEEGEELSELRRTYGPEAIVSRAGRFTLIHLDNPAETKIRTRVEEFDPDAYFFDDCPLCRIARDEGGHIVFDGGDASPTSVEETDAAAQVN